MLDTDKLFVLALFNVAAILLVYLFKGWAKEAWLFMWSDLNAKAEYCKKHKPFGLWRAFNRVMMTLALLKWIATCIACDVYLLYNFVTGAPLFG